MRFVKSLSLVPCIGTINRTKMNHARTNSHIQEGIHENTLEKDWQAIGGDLWATFKKIEELNGKRKKPPT